MKTTKGFTLIELIVVIVLISILSAVGIGLFSSPDQYTARLAADRWLAVFRLAQRLALQKQNQTDLVTLSVTGSGNSWSMSIDQGGTNLSQFDIENKGLQVFASNTVFSGACSALPALTLPLTLYFDGYGNSVSSTRVQASNSQRVCLVGASVQSLCISPSGYAYEGSCEN
ncbi:pilus assembly FimT family protein [Pseudomonas sp. HK3]